MGPGQGRRHVLGVTLVLAICLAVSACGDSTVVTTSSTNVLSQTQQRLERAVGGDARRNIRRYWKGRFRFAVQTRCRPAAADGGSWACTTTISSSRPGTTTCRIKTRVHSTESAFRFQAPLPFARNVFSEGCPTLHSELPNS
ncbi:MAG: hypothetical protein WAL22_19935 [Solirubrobacteraceae bacterium]